MDLLLEGKRALVTGSTRGIGAVIAKTLAEEGVKIVIHGRNADAAHAVASGIGGDVAVTIGDLADIAAADRVADEAEAKFGGIDILINNAAMFGPSSWDDTNAQDWAELYAVNVTPAVRLSARFVQQMKARRWGRLIHIGSMAGAIGLPMAPNYAATKAALASMSSSLAKSYGKFGITSNILGLGMIANIGELAPAPDPDSGAAEPASDPAYAFMTGIPDGYYHINPLGRSGTTEEVAYIVSMLASPRSAFVNGALIRVDGGAVSNIGL